METIELIRELMPLMRDAGDGAFFLTVLLIGQHYFTSLLVTTFFVFLAVLIYKTINRFSLSAQIVRELVRLHDSQHHHVNQRIYFLSNAHNKNNLIKWMNKVITEPNKGDD